MILILGGGLAGMSTAMHLGEREHLVLEASSTPGGLCRTRCQALWLPGYHHDNFKRTTRLRRKTLLRVLAR